MRLQTNVQCGVNRPWAALSRRIELAYDGVLNRRSCKVMLSEMRVVVHWKVLLSSGSGHTMLFLAKNIHSRSMRSVNFAPREWALRNPNTVLVFRPILPSCISLSTEMMSHWPKPRSLTRWSPKIHRNRCDATHQPVVSKVSIGDQFQLCCLMDHFLGVSIRDDC